MRWPVLAAAALLACCARPPVPLPVGLPRYVLGAPYQLGGLWSYPREDFSSVETGLAELVPDRRAGRRTANGEIHDPGALVAAHRTLQLPTIATVTNLENGRALRVRVNDRGPERAGRVLGLSRRAALLLGVADGMVAQVRVAVDPESSRALAASLPADFQRAPAVATAPAGVVTAEALAPLDGARAADRARVDLGRGPAPALAADASLPPPERLPEALVQGPATPGRLVVELGRFFRRDLAQRQAASLGARVEAIGAGRQVQWRAVLGPFDEPAAADTAVAGVLAAGATEVTLRVE